MHFAAFLSDFVVVSFCAAERKHFIIVDCVSDQREERSDVLENSIIKCSLPLLSSLFLDSRLQHLSLNGIAAPILSFGALR